MKQKTKHLTFCELLRKYPAGSDVHFIANLILYSQPRPFQKLRGLLTLLDSGHEIRTGNKTTDLFIDGIHFSTYNYLESPVVVEYELERRTK